jgi:hypothetical protein
MCQGRGGRRRLFPCLRSEQRHASRSDAGVEDRPGDQPGGPYAPTTCAGATHPAQHLTHSGVPTVEGRQLRYSKATLAIAAGRQTIDRQVEAGQLVQRAGEDGRALSAGRGVGGH